MRTHLSVIQLLAERGYDYETAQPNSKNLSSAVLTASRMQIKINGWKEDGSSAGTEAVAHMH